MITTTDFAIVGGGVVGITLARSLAEQFPKARITVLEKEPRVAMHASGRNSGVVHAGFYYTANSLKARFTRDGNSALTRYCEEHGLTINRCGKLVVARSERDLPGLDELLQRARANSVPLHEVSAAEARELEPLCTTVDRALWSPTTSAVNPREVVESLARDAEALGVTISTDTAYRGRRRDRLRTSRGDIAAGYVVNAAGLHADQVARQFGFSERYRILPFKGVYLYRTGTFPMRRHVYPVPNLSNPFLGVHFTVTVDGAVKIGPTAIPAFWREQYSGLDGFRLSEFVEVLAREAALFLRNDFGFRTLARDELRKYSRRELVRQASELAPTARPESFERWGPAGIRAQLYDVRERRLEMDFKYEGDDRSFHVLNAVSPAFTCAIPFSAHLVDEIKRLLR